jgi:putative transposase
MKKTLNKNYKYRIYPTPEQEMLLNEYMRTLRFIWNWGHAERLKIYDQNKQATDKGLKKYISYYDQKKLMTQLQEIPNTKENYFWNRVQCQARQKILESLDTAWNKCFKKLGGQPRFKSIRDDISIYIPAATVKYNLNETNIRFDGPSYKRLGNLKIVMDRTISGTIKSWTIKKDLNEWYAVACITSEVDIPVNTKPFVGIDLGVKLFVADSNGRTITNPNFGKQNEARVKKLSKDLSRKAKGSKNKEKARIKLAKLQRRVARQREVFVNTQSKYYADNYSKVVVEDLKINNMSKSAKGTTEKPGKNVKAKSGLNKSILDCGWGAFKSTLKYKLEDNGGEFIEVNPRNTSRECSKCGHIAAENRKTQEQFICVKCGYEKNADINAAQNILTRANEEANIKAAKEKTRVKRNITRKKKNKDLELENI